MDHEVTRSGDELLLFTPTEPTQYGTLEIHDDVLLRIPLSRSAMSEYYGRNGFKWMLGDPRM